MSSHHLFCVSIVLATVVHQIVTENAKNASLTVRQTAAPVQSSSLSSSMPNLLTSDGQIKLFPYNPNEASARSELIHIMGHSAIVKPNNTNATLPVLPRGVHSYTQFSGPPMLGSSVSSSSPSSKSAIKINAEMEEKLNFLKITETQLRCFIAPPLNDVLRMSDVIIDYFVAASLYHMIANLFAVDGTLVFGTRLK